MQVERLRRPGVIALARSMPRPIGPVPIWLTSWALALALHNGYLGLGVFAATPFVLLKAVRG